MRSGRWSSVGADGKKGSVGGLLGRLRLGRFFNVDVATGLHERGEGRQHGQHSFKNNKFRSKTPDQLEHKLLLCYRLIAIRERVGERLEAVTVGRGREVTLDGAMELGLEMHGATGFVGAEDFLEPVPGSPGGDVRLSDHVIQLLRDGVVDPHEDHHVFFDPITVRLVVVDAVDVVAQIKAPKEKEEGVIPLTPIVRLDVKLVGDHGRDVDCLCSLDEGGRGLHDGWRGCRSRGRRSGVGRSHHGSGGCSSGCSSIWWSRRRWRWEDGSVVSRFSADSRDVGKATHGDEGREKEVGSEFVALITVKEWNQPIVLMYKGCLYIGITETQGIAMRWLTATLYSRLDPMHAGAADQEMPETTGRIRETRPCRCWSLDLE